MKYILFYILILILSCKSAKKTQPETQQPPITIEDSGAGVAIDSFIYPSPEMPRNGEMENSDGEMMVEDDNYEYPDILVEPKREMGRLMFDVPDTMFFLQTYTILFRISRNKKENIEQRTLKPRISAIPTSERMEVSLVDPKKAFEIAAITPARQFIEKQEYSEWVYSVKPVKTGRLTLNVLVSIMKGDDNKYTVYENVVVVVSKRIYDPYIPPVASFFEKYWQWLFTALIIPFVVWYFNRNKTKK